MTQAEEARRRLSGIREKLDLLTQAVADIRRPGPVRRRAASLNAAAWAYGVEQGIRRLKALDRAGYDATVQPVLDCYLADQVVGWRMAIRSDAIHDAPPTFQSGTYINHLDSNQVAAMQHAAPPGTTSTFFGDSLGGSGYVVTDDDGNETNIYFELPTSIGSTWVNFPNAPDGRSLEDLAQALAEKTSFLVDRAISWVGTSRSS